MTALSSLLIIIFIIYLLAIITDEYFIESLDQITQKLRLPPNVAGASLMAVGSSAPELAIALLALFQDGGAHSDLGIGTIVGSAVFNVLIITGASAIVRPARMSLRVISRDVIMYLASIALLFVTFSDSSITVMEALAFVGLYALYILILFQWDNFVPAKQFGPASELDFVDMVEAELHSAAPPSNLFIQIHNWFSKIIGFLTGNARQVYLRAFSVSIVLIALLSWVLVEQAIRFSNALQIPPVIVALTILAAGTSVPDLLASIIVARQGRGEMAIANAIGSNIFDILIGLGVPWLVAMLWLGDSVHVGADTLWTSAIILLATVILLFIFAATQRRLTRGEGWALVSAYVVYVGWTLLGS